MNTTRLSVMSADQMSADQLEMQLENAEILSQWKKLGLNGVKTNRVTRVCRWLGDITDVIDGDMIQCGCSSVNIYKCILSGDKIIARNITNEQRQVVMNAGFEWSGRTCNTCKDIDASGSGKIRWITRLNLLDGIEKLTALIPPTVTAVAGVPRSGMIIAADISTRLSLPLYSITRKGELQHLGHGIRLDECNSKRDGKILIIEDSANSGASLRDARDACKWEGGIITAAVFKNPTCKFSPDIFAEILPSPHLFEWHFFGSGYASLAGFDIDGVLFREKKPHGPLYIPRWRKVPLIATGRSEKHRRGTVRWLKRWSIEYERLVMWTGEDGVPDQYKGIHKAEAYRESSCRWFVESCPIQSETIAKLSGKPVICPQAGKIFN